MKEVQTDSEEAAFRAIKDEIERLYAAGYKAVDVKTGVDEQGNPTITVVPREEKQEAVGEVSE